MRATGNFEAAQNVDPLVALSDTPVTINDPGCTSKTFPDYFTKFASVSQR